MVFLQGVGVSTSLAVRIYKQYADASIGVVRTAPYRLAADVWGIGSGRGGPRPPNARSHSAADMAANAGSRSTPLRGEGPQLPGEGDLGAVERRQEHRHRPVDRHPRRGEERHDRVGRADRPGRAAALRAFRP